MRRTALKRGRGARRRKGSIGEKGIVLGGKGGKQKMRDRREWLGIRIGLI